VTCSKRPRQKRSVQLRLASGFYFRVDDKRWRSMFARGYRHMESRGQPWRDL